MPEKRKFEFDDISKLTESEQDKLFQELLQAKRQRTGDLGSSSESEAEMLKGKGAKSRMSTGFPDRGRTAVGPQVEHASAYVLFEELAISAIKSMKRSDAPKAIADWCIKNR